MKRSCLAVVLVSLVAMAWAEPSSLTTSVSWRVRAENWSFFNPNIAGVDNSYIFAASLLRTGINGKVGEKQDWQLELSQVSFAGLPDNAIAPAPHGDLGLGATYYRWNAGRDGSLFVKQAFWRWRDLAGKGSMLRLGRFEFGEGTERMPKDTTLAWLRRARIAERLIGPFGFTHVQRSFDGLHFSLDRPQGNFTLALLRPTRGAFDLKGNDELSKVTVGYGGWTFAPDGQSDARLFALHYRDTRKPPKVIKMDNRPVAAREADAENIAVTTLGGHYLRTWAMGNGKADVLLWCAWQFGDWGILNHKANALALEAGYQWTKAQWQPWLRIGYFIGSGDDDPDDGDHKTFFQVLPTGRVYARTPIYNLMNNRDLFVQLMLKPTKQTSLRLDWRRLSLANAADLWYAGGGAFNHKAFGYIGRPSGGQSRLMDLVDLSLDYIPDPKTTWTLYLGRAMGKGVVQNIFPAGANATFIYLEWLRRW